MTDRDRLIELLKGNPPYHINEVAFWQDEHIGALADYLIANGVTVTDNNVGCKWISVEDRLPTDNSEVLVCRYNSKLCFCTIQIDRYDGYGKWDELNSLYDTNIWSVTHWMPLPQPPKEVE